MKKLIPVVVIVALVLVPLVYFVARSATPVIDLPSPPTAIGQATPVAVQVSDPRGVRSVKAFVEQNGTRYPVFDMAQPTKSADNTWSFTAGVKTTPQLQAGKAKLIVEATSNDLMRKSATVEHDVTVVTQPPSVSVDSEQHYLYLGMADLATLNVSGAGPRQACASAIRPFRAWPMPGGKPGLFSLYAFAWNMPTDTIPVVYASNGTGNDVTSPLVVIFPKKEQPKYTAHDLQVSDAVHAEGGRRTRSQRLGRSGRALCEDQQRNAAAPTTRRLPICGSKPRTTFCGRSRSRASRTRRRRRRLPMCATIFITARRSISRSISGYDLAVTQHVGVEASNDGKVVYAAPLGIYGNCIVVDHGYGLQTIYGHLSRIDVHEGDMVKRGQVMGLSGMTGMAGGDHIHFAMQLDGVQIDPKEWWDPHWIKDHIARRVPLPGFEGK